MGAPCPPPVNPRLKSSLLWGLVGTLVFLVLVQSWRLTGGPRIDLGVMIGAAAITFAGAALGSYILEEVLVNGQA